MSYGRGDGPRHPERTVLFRVLFHYFDRFLTEYESRFEKDYGFLRELLSTELGERLLSWRHTGFNVHSRVRAKTKKEAEPVGKYMIRPVLSLDEREGQIGYRYGQEAKDLEHMDYLEFIAFLTDYAVVDKIIDHLKLTFVADRPPPPHIAYQEALMAASSG
jgi:hypothetical protein